MHDTLGSARNKEGLATSLGELTDVPSAEAINILLVRYGRSDVILGQVRGKGKLDQDTVNSRIIVQLADLVEQLRLSDGCGQVNKLAVNGSLGQVRDVVGQRSRKNITSAAALSFMRT